MKKFLVTSLFIFVFGVYAFSQYFGTSTATSYVATQTPNPTTTTTPKTPSPAVSGSPATSPSTKPTPTPTPQPVKKNTYADGTFTGDVADAYYGNIQVQVVITNGKIVDVIFLQSPNDRSTSIRINSIAMPALKSEAISAQSANVDIVSGATDSSQAFQQSLGSALAQARNA